MRAGLLSGFRLGAIICAFLAVFWNTAGIAGVVLEKFDGKATAIRNDFAVYEDASASLTAKEVLQKRKEFVGLSENELVKGYSRSAFWVLFTVKNKGELSDIQLAASYPPVKLDVYRIVSFEPLRLAHEQQQERRTPSSALHLDPGEQETFLVRITSGQLVSLQMVISEKRLIDKHESFQNTLYALLAGSLFTAFVTNFILFIILRQRSYFYYLLFSLVNCHLTFFAVKFPSDILEWGGVNWDLFGHPYSTMGAFTTFLFVRSFLRTPTEFPKLDKVMKAYMVGILFFTVAELLHYDPLLPNLADGYYQVGIFILIVAGIKSMRSGFMPSRYYLVSLCFFLAGIATFLTLSYGYLPANQITLNALVIGQTAEMLMMSFALSSRLRLVEMESARSQEKTQLIKTIAHDVANSLNIIKLSVDYSTKIGLEKSFQQIYRAAESIEGLIAYIHERHSHHSPKAKLISVPVLDVFEDLRFAYKDRAKTKGIELVFDSTESGLHVKAHRSTLTHQVLGNLLSNAIKFSHAGSSIHIRARNQLGRIIIEISDAGDGMSADTIRRMMEETNRNQSKAGTNGERGFGYGISIVRDTLRSSNGRLEISSRLKSEDAENSGTVVKVILNSAGYASRMPEPIQKSLSLFRRLASSL